MNQLGSRSEVPLKRRSLIIRLTSRGVDYGISNTLILIGGMWYQAAAIGAVLNCSIDYIGQKYWVFSDATEQPRRSLKEVLTYIGLRILFGLPSIGILLLLYKVLGLPYLISSLVVTILMWSVTFNDFQALFTGNTGGILKPLQQIIGRLKKGAHSL